MVSISWRGPRGQWWEGRGGRQPSLAQVQAPLWRRMNTAAFTRHRLPALPQTGPEVRPGQGGSRRALPHPLPRSTGASCLQLLPLPSPDAREAASGVWMGQMAGNRLGGTAEWWKVGRGHHARPLATQLFSPRGGWELPQQQAEAKVTEQEDGLLPAPRKPSQGEEPGSARP